MTPKYQEMLQYLPVREKTSYFTTITPISPNGIAIDGYIGACGKTAIEARIHALEKFRKFRPKSYPSGYTFRVTTSISDKI